MAKKSHHHHHHHSGVPFMPYYIDIVPEDYEPDGKYWQPPVFRTGSYGGAIPIPISAEDYEIPDDAMGQCLSGFFDDVAKVAKGAVKSVGKVAGDVVHTANQAANLATKPLSGIPVVGNVMHTIGGLNPASQIASLASKVASGERLDKVALDAARGQIAAVKEIAPYAAMVSSFVPGVGTGAAAALAAGTALAEGRTINDAVIAAVRNSVPGGALGKTAFDSAMALAHGDSVSDTALKVVEQQIPPAAVPFLRSAAKMAKGASAKTAVLSMARNLMPADARKAFDVATALAEGRNIQSKVLNNIVKPTVFPKLRSVAAPVLKHAPKLMALHKALPPEAKKGLETAVGLLSQKGINAHSIVALRAAIPAAQRHGFDVAVKHAVNAANPHFTSLVTRGMILRGNWVPAKSNETGAVLGRLIQGATHSKGFFKRV